MYQKKNLQALFFFLQLGKLAGFYEIVQTGNIYIYISFNDLINPFLPNLFNSQAKPMKRLIFFNKSNCIKTRLDAQDVSNPQANQYRVQLHDPTKPTQQPTK